MARTIDNVVMTEGRNLAFDTFLAGSTYTVTGPYMGLISLVGFTATDAGDIGTQWKRGWRRQRANYTGNRKTCVWAGAGSGAKALSAALSFAITGAGTVEGCFIPFVTPSSPLQARRIVFSRSLP
jgi:hypothetical protein